MNPDLLTVWYKYIYIYINIYIYVYTYIYMRVCACLCSICACSLWLIERIENLTTTLLSNEHADWMAKDTWHVSSLWYHNKLTPISVGLCLPVIFHKHLFTMTRDTWLKQNKSYFVFTALAKNIRTEAPAQNFLRHSNELTSWYDVLQ